MVGRYPVSVISVEMDLAIDVNVHPTKQEVRLLDSRELSDFISKSIYASLSQRNLIPDALDNQSLKRGLSEHNTMEVALNFDELEKQTNDTETLTSSIEIDRTVGQISSINAKKKN